MFSSSSFKQPHDSFSKHRAGKATTSRKATSFKDKSFSRKIPAELDLSQARHAAPVSSTTRKTDNVERELSSSVVTVAVGLAPSRMFAAHADVLKASPYLEAMLQAQFYSPTETTLHLPSEVPEVFPCVLEFLYKGDYTPKLVKASANKYKIEENGSDNTVWISASLAPASPVTASPHPTDASGGMGVFILKDTAVYCAADRFGLPLLKRLALRKQGLHAGVPVSTILASARYAYANTPDHDRHLRAHYLALIIRSRNTFKRSGTMQAEMGGTSVLNSPDSAGGCNNPPTGLWFDLTAKFVAMCNHLDDVESLAGKV